MAGNPQTGQNKCGKCGKVFKNESELREHENDCRSEPQR